MPSTSSTVRSNQLSARRMWLYYGILTYLFGFLLAKSFDDAGRYSSFLERKLTLKLKTAARLKHNLGKVLHELPIQSYEMHHSVKIVEDYLKNGGSLLECLDVLPSVTYAPIAEQIDSILGSMENHLPVYLLPVISLIRRSLSEGLLDVNEIYRPTFGPPKADPLEKITAREVKEAASPLTYRAPVKDLGGPWPKIVGETATLIHDQVIPPRSQLIAYILANLRIPDATAEVRESVVLLVEHLQTRGKRELTGFSVSSDPYALVANAVASLPLQNEMLTAANVLLPFLRGPSECRGSAEFADFFQNDVLNYTLLISRDRTISKSKDGIAFLSTIQQNNTDVRDVIEQFSPFEYTLWKDLLLAFVSQLRRQQTHRGEMSNVIDSVYGELILKNGRKRWQLLRNSIIAAPLLSAIARRENSVRIRRLLIDVATDRTVKPEVWQKALAFASSENISGPMNAALKTLKALLTSGLLPYGVLSMNVAELITTFGNRIDQGQAECASRLETYLANFTQVEIESGRKMAIGDVDVKDLLQALPNLDIYTDEYRILESFLSHDDLEKKIGQVDLNAHPTRGRLLAQLLQMIERAGGVDDNLRRLAEQFADNVAYHGYGAGALSYRS
ncbi:PREDICTED: uncharacterized protein LOC105452991 [Wasmannia auropunctata]|uniref:uncharacterized protein LOC105452991 n=1 Tax=Wasmannia auropunctata TaxID=64793 RepID=UPI0005F00400|nr:PREDICTED: uncharacterized protein LOC105452991 [Wasmannia auropunctata]